jgi:hypothetical protein
MRWSHCNQLRLTVGRASVTPYLLAQALALLLPASAPASSPSALPAALRLHRGQPQSWGRHTAHDINVLTSTCRFSWCGTFIRRRLFIVKAAQVGKASKTETVAATVGLW